MRKKVKELRIDGEWSPPANVTVLLCKRLRMIRNSTIILDSTREKFQLIASKSTIESGCSIDAAGEVPGRDGVDLSIYLGAADINELHIDTSGAKGVKGNKGEPGRNGHHAQCLKKPAGNGGTGHRGGQGGAGGKGGNILLLIKKGSARPKALMVSSRGGQGGDGGEGGDGGKGGNGKRCGIYKHGAGANGNRGPSGEAGSNGDDGIVNISFVKRFRSFSNFSGESKVEDAEYD